MALHDYGIIFVLVGFLISLVWVVLDNKKFYEELDKQRYGWYNKEEEKQGGHKNVGRDFQISN